MSVKGQKYKTYIMYFNLLNILFLQNSCVINSSTATI